MRRWQEIKMRQRRLLAEAEQTTPAHIEQIMKSGFSMSDIKTLQRDYSEDAVEADEVMMSRPAAGKKQPPRPPRKGSLSRYDDNIMNGQLSPGGKNRSASELDLNKLNGEAKDKKTRGRSPFR